MGMSDFDRAHLSDIIDNGVGDWFNARLLRALSTLLPFADAENTRILEAAYPEQCKAVRNWYNGHG